MFEEVLSKDTKNTLAILGESSLLKGAYLAGGTALALHIGHRISVDFDFFTKKEFNENSLIQKFTSLPLNFRLEKTDAGTVLGYLGKTKFSLFFYKYPILAKVHKFLNLNILEVYPGG